MNTENLSRGAIGSGRAAHNPVVPAGGNASWSVFSQIPDLVNGDPATYNFIFVGAGLNAAYHWVTDAFFANVPPPTDQDSLRNRICIEATVYALAIAGTGVPAAKARTIGLLMASSRMAIRRSWGVTDRDIVTTQLKVPVDDAAAAVTVSAVGVPTAAIDGHGTVAAFAAALTAVQDDWDANADTVYYRAQLVGIGMPVTNGVTIVFTLIHHYQDPHKQVCDAVVDQHFPADAVLPNALTRDELKDTLCHKSAHCLKSPILVGLSRAPAVIERLSGIGQGAAIVRLPAKFAPERAADAIDAVCHQAAAAAKGCNVEVSLAPVEQLITDMAAAIGAASSQQALLQATALIDAFKKAHGSDVAFIIGILVAQMDEVKANKRARSIVGGHTVPGFIETYNSDYARGYEHYLDSSKWRRARARDGYLAGYGVMGADKPADYGDAPQTSGN